MNVKERILHYLVVYDGEKQGAEKRVKEDLLFELPRNEHKRITEIVFYAFMELEGKGNIKIIPYEKMTANQKHRFDTENKIFYQIINRNID